MIIIFKMYTITVQIYLTGGNQFHSHTLTSYLRTTDKVISIIKNLRNISLSHSIVRQLYNLLTQSFINLHCLSEEWHFGFLNLNRQSVTISSLSIKCTLSKCNRQTCTATYFIQFKTCNLLYRKQLITEISSLVCQRLIIVISHVCRSHDVKKINHVLYISSLKLVSTQEINIRQFCNNCSIRSYRHIININITTNHHCTSSFAICYIYRMKQYTINSRINSSSCT